MKKPIPQYEIPFRDGDTFALVGERGVDQARIEEERRAAASRAAAARYFAKRHQLTFEQRHAELVLEELLLRFERPRAQHVTQQMRRRRRDEPVRLERRG